MIVHWEQTPSGIWVRAREVVNGVEVAVQPRVTIHGGQWQRYTVDGMVAASGAAHTVRYAADPWEPLGTIAVTPSSVQRAGLARPEQWDHVVRGIARHVVGLIVAGWGEQAQDVLALFDPLEAGSWVIAEEYLIEGPTWSPLGVDLLGMRCVRVTYEDGVLSGTVHVTSQVQIPFAAEQALGAWLVGARPCTPE